MERLAASKDVAGHKLLILYILDKLNIAIASIDLTNYILEERLMNFITFQQRVHELILTNHVSSAADDGVTKYMITGGGAGILSEMSDLIPRTEKNRVDRTVRRLSRHVINSRSVKAVYIPSDEHSGIVRVELNEGNLSAMSLEIATASKEEARIICDNWKARTAELYAGIVDLLLSANEEKEQSAPPEETGL